jgi:HSP20 family protein
VEVPGIDEKDIDVRLENNTLTMHGERKFEKQEKEENYPPGGEPVTAASPARSRCRRRLIQRESLEANYEKGILKVKIAKKAEAKPKQIKVNVGSVKTLAMRRRLKASGPDKAA